MNCEILEFGLNIEDGLKRMQKKYLILKWAKMSQKTSLLHHLSVSHEHLPLNFAF